MAGTQQRSIPFSGWNCNIFEGDAKIDKLLDAKGTRGFYIYFYLCQKAFSTDGYYYKWCYDVGASTARRMGCGIGADTLIDVVNYCLQIGLFDQGLFDRWQILSSHGIQRSYWRAVRKRRVREVYSEYWLLNSEECEGLVKVSLKTDMLPTNAHMLPTNEHDAPLKVKESKVKERNTYSASEAEALFERVWKMYPNKKGKGQVSARDKQKLCAIGEDVLLKCIERYKKELAENTWLHPKNGSTFFHSGYIDYLDENYERRKPATTNKFNNFEGHDCNFDELAAGLIRN